MKRYILDTNAFLRYILNDIPSQADEVTRIFVQTQNGDAEVTIPLIVFVEASYVLITGYKYSREIVQDLCEKFLSIPSLDIPDRHILRSAYVVFVRTPSVSITDIVLLFMAVSEGKTLVTFDKKLQKLAERIGKEYTAN